MGKPKIEEAIDVIRKAKEDGTVTIKEILWLVAVWIQFVGEVAEELVNPTTPLDRDWAEDILQRIWNELQEVLQGIDVPWSAKFVLPVIQNTIPMLIGPAVDWIADVVDADDYPDLETYYAKRGMIKED